MIRGSTHNWLFYNFSIGSLISKLIEHELSASGEMYGKWPKALFPTRLLTSEDECKWFWHQMIYFPGTINIVSIQLYCHAYITMNLFCILQLCTSTLTLCMLASWSREGVVFVVLSSSSHLTVSHVFPLPISGANWRSLSLLWGPPPPSPNMAPLSTGSAHTPFLGYKTSMQRQTGKCTWRILETIWAVINGFQRLFGKYFSRSGDLLSPDVAAWRWKIHKKKLTSQRDRMRPAGPIGRNISTIFFIST